MPGAVSAGAVGHITSGIRHWLADLVAPVRSLLEGVGLLVRRLLFDGTGAGVDTNYESHVRESGTVIGGRVIPAAGEDPGEYSDILKFSDCTNIVVENSAIAGGAEDAIDAVRGADYTFRDLTLRPDGNGITAKGAIDTIVIENVVFETHGRTADLEFGQFDDYWYIGRDPTRNITIRNVHSLDGRPVVVVLWDATDPTVIDSTVMIIKVPKILWWPYFVIRSLHTRGFAGL